MSLRILLVDNYDSFTHNLAHGLAQAGQGSVEVEVVRNNEATLEGIRARRPDAIALSPGPGHPANARDFGVCADLVRSGIAVPMLGVCLGMQGMACHSGGKVLRAPEPVHGEAHEVLLDRHPLFEGLPRAITAGRYHSLVVDPATLPAQWQVVARTVDGTPMGMAHRGLPWFGLQFHPESILTPHGPAILRNFLEACG